MIGGAFRYNAENVRYHATPWLTGDGSTSSGTLLDRHGNPISSGKLKRVDAIHRTDWQGRQVLYPTARTNSLKQSEDFGTAAWVTTGAALATGQTAPDGSTHAAWLTAAASGTAVQAFAGQGSVPNARGVVRWLSVFAKADTLGFIQLVGFTAGDVSLFRQNFDLTAGVANPTPFLSTNCTVIGTLVEAVPSGGWRCHVGVVINDTATTINLRLQLTSSLTNNGFVVWAGTERIKVFGASYADAPGVYIPTTAAPMAVTDYTLTGPSVALGQVPVVGAVLDWDGVAKR